MSRQRRSRLTVDRAVKAGLYNPILPPGWEVIGTVETAEGVGALVRNCRTGIYCQANAGALRSLPQHKVVAALNNSAGSSGTRASGFQGRRW